MEKEFDKKNEKEKSKDKKEISEKLITTKNDETQVYYEELYTDLPKEVVDILIKTHPLIGKNEEDPEFTSYRTKRSEKSELDKIKSARMEKIAEETEHLQSEWEEQNNKESIIQKDYADETYVPRGKRKEQEQNNIRENAVDAGNTIENSSSKHLSAEKSLYEDLPLEKNSLEKNSLKKSPTEKNIKEKKKDKISVSQRASENKHDVEEHNISYAKMKVSPKKIQNIKRQTPKSKMLLKKERMEKTKDEILSLAEDGKNLFLSSIGVAQDSLTKAPETEMPTDWDFSQKTKEEHLDQLYEDFDDDEQVLFSQKGKRFYILLGIVILIVGFSVFKYASLNSQLAKAKLEIETTQDISSKYETLQMEKLALEDEIKILKGEDSPASETGTTPGTTTGTTPGTTPGTTTKTTTGTEDYTIYTTQQNDTFWDISAKVYGNGAYYTRILEANGMKETDIIHEGKQLKIPK